jgi:hypothetical protein
VRSAPKALFELGIFATAAQAGSAGTTGLTWWLAKLQPSGHVHDCTSSSVDLVEVTPIDHTNGRQTWAGGQGGPAVENVTGDCGVAGAGSDTEAGLTIS